MTRCRGLISIEIEVINRLDFFKMYKRGIFILFACISCLLTVQSARGQFTISGTVKDKTDDSPLPQVSIRLLAARDSSFVTGVSSKDNGTFTLTVNKAGNYLAAFSFLGYKTTYEPVRLTAGQPRRNLGSVLLESNDILLQEAVVVGKAPEVVVKEDTVEFNADSYKTQPNSVVEDLLKKLPGVEVDSEGKITHAGKEITKILVDGKEFFSDDPKIATKNLPVDIIEKLQVVDRKSDLARLTGVDDGEEETVINLTIKKGMKHGWFGNVSGGYGLDGRYEAGAMINRFFGDNQITILAGSNNTNNMGFTDLGGSRFRRFGGMNGINTSHNVGVNFNVGKGEEFRVGGDVSYNNSNRNVLQRTERQNLFADSTSYYSGHNKMNDHGQNFRGNFRIHWEIDSLNTLEFRPKFAVALSRSDSYDSALTTAGDLARSKVNFSESDNFNKGTGYDLSGELIYNHKFLSRPGRSFSIHAEYKFSDTKEDGWTKALYKYYQLATDSTLDQIDDDHTWSNGYGARLTWTEPLGDVSKGRFLTFSYRFQANFNNADKFTYDVFTDPLTSLPLDTLRNDDLSNSFRNDYYMHRAQVGFKQVKPTYTYDVGVAVEPSSSQSTDLINSSRNIPKRTVFNVAPYLRYRYKMGKQTSLRIDYRGSSSQPTMTQLQPVADVSDPLRVVIGNPTLKPSFKNTLRVRFNDYDEKTQRAIMAMFFGGFTTNSIISETTYDATTGGQTTTYRNVNGVWNASGMLMYSTPFSNKHWQLNSFSRLSYNNDVGYNNGLRNNAGSFNASENLGIAFRSDYFDAELRGNYRYLLATNSMQNQKDQSTHNYGGTLNLSGYLPWSITLGTDLTYSGSAGYSAGYNTESWLWNAQASYQFLKGKNATIALKVYDILGQRNSIRRTVTGNYIQDVEYNTLNTYGLITFTYRFNTFGDKRPDMGPGGPRGYGHPGPPPGGPGGHRPF